MPARVRQNCPTIFWPEQRSLDWLQLDENGFSKGILRLVVRPQRPLPQPPGSVDSRTTAESYSLDRRQRFRQQRTEFSAIFPRRLGTGLCVQFRWFITQGLLTGSAVGRMLARSIERRCYRVQRLRGR